MHLCQRQWPPVRLGRHGVGSELSLTPDEFAEHCRNPFGTLRCQFDPFAAPALSVLKDPRFSALSAVGADRAQVPEQVIRDIQSRCNGAAPMLPACAVL
jgi:hypothetical protein